MLCAASGNPDPEITWFKDFLPVNTSSNNGRIKQLRSGNHRFSPSFPFSRCFYFHPVRPLLLPLCFSSLCQYLLPLFHRLIFISCKAYVSLALLYPLSLLITALHISCHGSWLCFSVAAVIYELIVLLILQFLEKNGLPTFLCFSPDNMRSSCVNHHHDGFNISLTKTTEKYF